MQCAQHPETEAFHQCTLCAAWHCEACLKRVETRGTSRPLLACPTCGGLAHVAVERVPEQRDDLLDVLRRPFTEDGGVTVFALAVPAGLTIIPINFLPAIFACIYLGCLAGYYFQTVEHIGRGRPGLPFSIETTSRSGVAIALGRGLACLLVGVGPAALWGAFVPGLPVVTFLLLVLGAALAPAAIIAVSVSRNGFVALWPFFWARVMARAPAAYGRLVGLFTASTAVWALGIVIAANTLGRIPIAGAFLVGAVNAALALLQATLVGGFLRRNSAELGYDD